MNDNVLSSRDAHLSQLYANVKDEPSVENMKALNTELDSRLITDNRFKEMFPQHIDSVKGGQVKSPKNFDCLRSLVSTYEQYCAKLDEYSFKYVSAFVADCETTGGNANGLSQIKNVCKSI